jgi:O-antigen ligase
MEGDEQGFLMENIYIHNSYLWIGVKTGLIGLALFLAIIVLPLVRGIGALRRMEEGQERACVLGLIAALIAGAIASMFAEILTSDHGAPLLAILIGCLHLLCADRRQQDRYPETG